MAYFIRLLCTGEEVPPVSELLQWMEERDVKLEASPQEASEIHSDQWQRVALTYRKGRQPLIITCERGGNDSPAIRQQLSMLIDKIGSPGRSNSRKKVIDHLRHTHFIVTLEVPRADMNDAGWDANGQILTFFAEQSGALIQADGEGFYERANLILATV